MSRKINKNLMSLVLALIMIFNIVPSFAAGFDGVGEVREIKLHADLKDKVERDEFVEVIVYLNEQIDTDLLVRKNYGSFSNSISDDSMKLMNRREVVDSLETLADESQTSLIETIEKGLKKGKVIEYESFHVVNAVYLNARMDLIKKIAKMPEVKMVYKNNEVKLDKPKAVANNEEYENENNVWWNIERLGADKIWEEFGITGKDVVVGIIDSGVDYNHEAIMKKWRGYDPENPDKLNYRDNWFDPILGRELPYDDDGHGTHVTGTVLGQDDLGEHKIGMAPGAKWIAAKAFTATGSSDRWLLAAGQWMLAPGGNPDNAPDIINNSWGGVSGKDEWYRALVRNWRNAGILPVFAAGNDVYGSQPGSVTSPGNYPESFTVGASDRDNERGNFSMQGPSPYKGDIKPDIMAPGLMIKSSVPGGGYEEDWQGTSMAAPAISGLAALMLEANGELTPDDIEDIIIKTAIALTDEQYPVSPNFGYGHGLANGYEAVKSIIEGTGLIKGRVMTEGEDLARPIIEHSPIGDTAYVNRHYDVEFTVEDDVAIVESTFYIKKIEDDSWTELVSNHTEGYVDKQTYYRVIDPEHIQKPGFEYKLSVKDYAGNVEESEVYKVKVLDGVLPDEYKTDFSEEPVGWRFLGDWQWGTADRILKPRFGDKLVGTHLDGAYANTNDDEKRSSGLITPPIDVSKGGYKDLSIRFHHWYDTRFLFDDCTIHISTDNSKTFQELEDYKFEGSKKKWESVLIDLSEYDGCQEPIYIAFVLEADEDRMGKSQNLGWYIDDFELTGNDQLPPESIDEILGEVHPNGNGITWDKSLNPDIDKYNIYRSEIDGDFQYIGSNKLNYYTDEDIELDKIYRYRVGAVDLAGNESDFICEIEIDRDNLEIIFNDEFKGETDMTTGIHDGDRFAGVNPWEYGELVPYEDWRGASPSESFSGGNVWATGLDKHHLTYSEGYVETPVITVPESSTSLQFTHWYKISQWDDDYGQVLVQVDGSDQWINVTPEGEKGQFYNGESENWESSNISLDEFSGEDIRIRFYYHSSQTSSNPGWYLDSVSVVAAEKIYSYSLGRSPKEVNAKSLSLARGNKVEDTQEVEEKKIPVNARITVVESGRHTRNNPYNGEFSMTHDARQYGLINLIVEAEGYYPEEISGQLVEGGILELGDIVLKKRFEESIVGKVVDKYSGLGIENARIIISELNGHKTRTVISNELGEFEAEDTYDGDYELRVSAKGYSSQTIVIDGSDFSGLEIALEKLVGQENEIKYDTGKKGDNFFVEAREQGVGVRFSVYRKTLVKGANIFFEDLSFPKPGGNHTSVAIFTIDEEGELGEMIGEPIELEVDRGEWNYVDLSSLSFVTDRDFFIATVQTSTGYASPSVCADNGRIGLLRSYLYMGDTMVPVTVNAMIRAVVDTSVDMPEIVGMDEINYVNKSEVNLEGKVNRDTSVIGYLDGEDVFKTTTDKKSFLWELDLEEGKHIVEIASVVNGKEGMRNKLEIIVDKTAPVIELDNSEEGFETSREIIELKGRVIDLNLEKLIIDGRNIDFQADGKFEEKFILEPGENKILVLAIDRAGNKTEKLVIINSKNGDKELKDLPVNTTIIGNKGYSIKYLNSSFDTQLELLEAYKLGRDIIIKISETVFVNLRGEVMEFSKSVEYFNDDGVVTIYR